MTQMSLNEIKDLVRNMVMETVGKETSNIARNTAETLKPIFDNLSKAGPNKLAGGWPGDSDSEPKFKIGYAKKAKDLFGESSETKGFNSLGECLLAIKNNDFSKTQYLTKDMDTQTGSAGGFLLPQNFSNQIIDLMLENEIVRNRCKLYTIKEGNNLIVPAVDDSDHSDSLGGVKVYWTGEGKDYTESQAKIRQINLKVNKVTALVDTSEELLADSAVNTQDLIGNIFAKALSFEIDSCVLTDAGTGAGKPLSITNGSNLITVSGEIGQVADSIQYENVCNMVMRMTPSGFNNSIWLSSLSNLKQLLTLTVKLGTAGSWVKIFTEESGVWKILGRPVIFTEHCAVLGDAGNLKLLDLSRYAMLLKQDIIVRSDASLGFKSDTLSFKASIRIDGQPLDNKVLTLKDGVTTVSPFIQLDTI